VKEKRTLNEYSRNKESNIDLMEEESINGKKKFSEHAKFFKKIKEKKTI